MSVNALAAWLRHAACPVTYPPDPSCLPLSHTHESTPLHTLPAGVSVDPPAYSLSSARFGLLVLLEPTPLRASLSETPTVQSWAAHPAPWLVGLHIC